MQTVFGVLLLKEMFGLTDAEALEQLEFNVLWHHALDLILEEAHLPQKTLHNFRARLMADDQARLAFEARTGRILEALGTDVRRQRLDSTHVMSNMAVRTRLGLFCETMRVFLKELEQRHPRLCARVPARVRGRYVQAHGTGSDYQDAWSADGGRRLEVCAQTGASFRERYAIRDGIEATNSELKRGHGRGHLRVRGRPRVMLATYLKALGCNIKRMVEAVLRAAEAPMPAVV